MKIGSDRTSLIDAAQHRRAEQIGGYRVGALSKVIKNVDPIPPKIPKELMALREPLVGLFRNLNYVSWMISQDCLFLEFFSISSDIDTSF